MPRKMSSLKSIRVLQQFKKPFFKGSFVRGRIVLIEAQNKFLRSALLFSILGLSSLNFRLFFNRHSLDEVIF